MIKKLFRNYIKDVLGKNLNKTKNKEEILNNQKIVANSLSNINNQQPEKDSEILDNPYERMV